MKKKLIKFYCFFSILVIITILFPLSQLCSQEYRISKNGAIFDENLAINKPALESLQETQETIDPENEIAEAEKLYLKGDYDKTIIKLQKLLLFIRKSEFIENKNEVFMRISLLFGSCYFKKGNITAAEGIFKKVLEIDPSIKIDKKIYGENVTQLFEKLKGTREPVKIERKEQIQPQTEKKIIEKPKKVFPKEIKIRVIQDGAVLRLKPEEESLIVKKLPVGGQLDAVESFGEWIKVKLPPDKDGIIVTGYIHLSFIEYQAKQEPQFRDKEDMPIIIEKKMSQPIQNADYLQWKEKLSKAQAKLSTGTFLTICGVVILVPSIAYTFYNEWPSSKENRRYLTGGGWVTVIIGDVVGVAGIIVGSSFVISGSSQRKTLEEEGKMKGYLNVGIVSKHKAVGIQFGVSF